MEKTKEITLDSYFYPVLTEDQAITALLYGNRITQPIVVSPDREKYDAACALLEGKLRPIFREPIDDSLTVEEYHALNSKIWSIPDKYLTMDILSYVLARCHTPIEIERVQMEWQKFKDRDLVDLLRCLVYISDTIMDNNLVLGVGRGSSCSSYILYKIGIHRVDSIRYQLNIDEFLKETYEQDLQN